MKQFLNNFYSNNFAGAQTRNLSNSADSPISLPSDRKLVVYNASLVVSAGDNDAKLSVFSANLYLELFDSLTTALGAPALAIGPPGQMTPLVQGFAVRSDYRRKGIIEVAPQDFQVSGTGTPSFGPVAQVLFFWEIDAINNDAIAAHVLNVDMFVEYEISQAGPLPS